MSVEDLTADRIGQFASRTVADRLDHVDLADVAKLKNAGTNRTESKKALLATLTASGAK